MNAFDTVTSSDVVRDTTLIDIEVARRMVREAVQADRQQHKMKMIIRRNRKRALLRWFVKTVGETLFLILAPLLLALHVDPEIFALVPICFIFAACLFITEWRKVF